MQSTITYPCLPPLSLRPSSEMSKSELYLSQKRVRNARMYAMRREDQNYNGRLVDESMIVLRKRIHEMKMVERNYEPPSDWMEWEKQYFTSYDSIICEAMGLLQSQLMNTRPSLALGIMALVTLSVPVSTVVVFFQFMEVIKMIMGLMAGVHLN